MIPPINRCNAVIRESGDLNVLFHLCQFGRARRTILASVAVAALAAAGAFAENTLTNSHAAHAAPVVTSDLNAQGAPSFATLIERVKPRSSRSRSRSPTPRLRTAAFRWTTCRRKSRSSSSASAAA